MTTDNHIESSGRFVEPVGGYGRIWQSMYEGSLAGAGLAVFAVWPYVIANMRRDAEYGAAVNLNPKLLAAKLGGTVEEIRAAIERLCEPDPESHNQAEGGRRLVKVSGLLYRVVNGAAFMAIRHAERQRELHRAAQARYVQNKADSPAREKKYRRILKGGGSLSERLAVEEQKEESKVRSEVKENPAIKDFVEKFNRDMAEAARKIEKVEEKLGVGEANGDGEAPVSQPEGAEGEKFPEV